MTGWEIMPSMLGKKRVGNLIDSSAKTRKCIAHHIRLQVEIQSVNIQI